MRQNRSTYFDQTDYCVEPSQENANTTGALPKSIAEKEPVNILVNMLDQEIIPRLLVSHKAKTSLENLAIPGERNVTIAEADFLAGLTIHGTQESSSDFVKKLIQKSVSIDSIFLDLIPQAARKLGELWESDICNFSDVTIGLWRLQHILYDMCKDFQLKNNLPLENLNALLIPAPNSQHTLGLFIVVECFRRAGWRVWGEPNSKIEEIKNLIYSQWFDVIGISIGYIEQLEGINELISHLRKRSMNPNVAFMLGGPLYNSHPELFDSVDADILSTDPNEAIRQAEVLVANHKLCSRN